MTKIKILASDGATKPHRDLSGKRFGSLTVNEFLGRGFDRQAIWSTKCNCGNAGRCTQSNLVREAVTACRKCGNKKTGLATRIHGDSESREHKIWRSMKGRCSQKNDKAYYRYGGRGIFVCPEWKNNYADFLDDMGRCPSKFHSLDRINNNGPYSKENCRWATRREQMSNTRINVYINYCGARITIAEFSRRTGILYATALWRFHKGITGEQLLSKSRITIHP